MSYNSSRFLKKILIEDKNLPTLNWKYYKENPQEVVAFATLANGKTYYSSGILNRLFKLRRIGMDKNRSLLFPETVEEAIADVKDWDS